MPERKLLAELSRAAPQSFRPEKHRLLNKLQILYVRELSDSRNIDTSSAQIRNKVRPRGTKPGVRLENETSRTARSVRRLQWRFNKGGNPLGENRGQPK